MNMFAKNSATSVQSYLQNVPEERRADVEYLHKLIIETVPKLKPHFAYNMLGYGSMKYKNYKKEVIDWPIVALANQKNYISIYICATDGAEYIAEKNKDKLGRVSVGKSCIRIKKLADLNLDELKHVLKLAEKSPGLVGVGAVVVE
jgi:hypothetical protein